MLTPTYAHLKRTQFCRYYSESTYQLSSIACARKHIIFKWHPTMSATHTLISIYAVVFFQSASLTMQHIQLSLLSHKRTRARTDAERIWRMCVGGATLNGRIFGCSTYSKRTAQHLRVREFVRFLCTDDGVCVCLRPPQSHGRFSLRTHLWNRERERTTHNKLLDAAAPESLLGARCWQQD